MLQIRSLSLLIINNMSWILRNSVKKGKGIDFTSPRTSSGQTSQPYETVPIGTISSPSVGGRKPQGEIRQALAVKGERHPTCRQS